MKHGLILCGLIPMLLAVLTSCSVNDIVNTAGAEEDEEIVVTEQAELNPARMTMSGDTVQVDFDKEESGDTAWFFLRGDETEIKLLGITCPDVDKAWGTEALNYTTERLSSGKKIYLEFDDSGLTDLYGSTIAWVWVGGSLLQEELLEQGLADMTTMAGNLKYADNLIAAREVARQNESGIWGQW